MKEKLQIITIASAIFIGRLLGLLLNHEYNNFLIKFILLIVIVSNLYSLFMLASFK